jgi:hypothetical protein
LVGLQVLGREDHAEGAMVEGRDGLITAIQDDAAAKTIPQASHDIHVLMGGRPCVLVMSKQTGGGRTKNDERFSPFLLSLLLWERSFQINDQLFFVVLYKLTVQRNGG